MEVAGSLFFTKLMLFPAHPGLVLPDLDSLVFFDYFLVTLEQLSDKLESEMESDILYMSIFNKK